jgi:SOS-response transcriptional repressor LexA
MTGVVHPTMGIGTMARSSPKPKSAPPNAIRIPVLGRVTTGIPIPLPASDFSCFDADDFIEISERFLPPRGSTRDLFALQVEGHGLIDACIQDGDILVLKPVPRAWRMAASDAGQSDLVVVYLPERNESVLTYLYRETDYYRLQAANPWMKPTLIRSTSKLEVEGRVVLVIRRMEV